jgi:outer membrane biosynthesis protein TonB
MLRTLLVVLALVVLLVIGLFYVGVLHWPGAGQPIQANPVDVKVEMKNVTMQVPTPSVSPTPEAQPVQPATNVGQPAPQPVPQPAPQPVPAR